MSDSNDPTLPIREKAAEYDEVVTGTSCNQSSFKTKKGSYLFIGPGPKGVGFKAMFKLTHSMDEARQLAAEQPTRFEVGNTGWVTTRFTTEEPLDESIWSRWLDESYAMCSSN